MYDPIFLTTSEQEERDLGRGLAALCEYLILGEEDSAQVYVQRIGDVVEIRPVQGTLESLTVLSSGRSGTRPKHMAVSCDGACLEITIDDGMYRVYFQVDRNPFQA